MRDSNCKSPVARLAHIQKSHPNKVVVEMEAFCLSDSGPLAFLDPEHAPHNFKTEYWFEHVGAGRGRYPTHAFAIWEKAA